MTFYQQNCCPHQNRKLLLESWSSELERRLVATMIE